MAQDTIDLAFIGFGEAAQAVAQGWDRAGLWDRLSVRAYDVKTDHDDASVRQAKEADYQRLHVQGCADLAEALAGRSLVFSLVTADQALTAARQAANRIAPGTLYCDGNSCSPGTKRQAAALIEQAGGRYLDVAIMAPVHPGLHRTPMLIAGPHAEAAAALLEKLQMNFTLTPGPVGTAAGNKMVRSIMVKGLEALVAECVLAGRRAGVDEAVLDSLDATFPGFQWRQRAAYMLERAMTHGLRRAAEMREVALTVEELDLPAPMSRAIADWQQRIGDLRLCANDNADYRHRADAILKALSPS